VLEWPRISEMTRSGTPCIDNHGEDMEALLDDLKEEEQRAVRENLLE